MPKNYTCTYTYVHAILHAELWNFKKYVGGVTSGGFNSTDFVSENKSPFLSFFRFPFF